MTRALLISILLTTSVATANESSFKAFRRNKIQFQAKTPVAPGDEILVLADTKCLEAQTRTTLSALSVKHKNSSGLNIQALSVKFIDQEQLLQLSPNPCIKGITENPVVTSQADPLSSQQTYLPAINEQNAQKFFAHPIFGVRNSVTVAVIDSGIEALHPDLNNSLWLSPTRTFGYDFYNDDNDPSDDFGHGTHVSGIIAAEQDNEIGIRGILGTRAKIMAVKTLGSDGHGVMAGLVNSIRWAVDNGAEIINTSLSARVANAALDDALAYAVSKNVFVAVAAGNDGQEITASQFFSPVGYARDYMGVISVGGIDGMTNLRSTFSNVGAGYVEMSAPAEVNRQGIFSTNLNSNYSSDRGTSQATPQVAAAAAGAAAFIKTRGSSVSAGDLELLLRRAAIQNADNAIYFQNGHQLDLERLGRSLFNSYVLDGNGGFDEP